MAIFLKIIIGYIWLFDDKIIVSSLVISCTMFEHVLSNLISLSPIVSSLNEKKNEIKKGFF